MTGSKDMQQALCGNGIRCQTGRSSNILSLGLLDLAQKIQGLFHVRKRRHLLTLLFYYVLQSSHSSSSQFLSKAWGQGRGQRLVATLLIGLPGGNIAQVTIAIPGNDICCKGRFCLDSLTQGGKKLSWDAHQAHWAELPDTELSVGVHIIPNLGTEFLHPRSFPTSLGDTHLGRRCVLKF